MHIIDPKAFIQKLKPIFEKEGIVWFDEMLFEKIYNAKRNTAGTIVKKNDGKKYFLKVLKPWAITWSFLEHQKAIFVYDILEKACVKTFPRVYSKGCENGLYYFIEDVIPIEQTLGDNEIRPLTEKDGIRIRESYENTQKKVNLFIEKNPITAKEAVALMPHSIFAHSNYSQNASFWGQIVLFENQLRNKGYIFRNRISEYVLNYIEKNKNELFWTEKMYLLHGDFAPHNVVYGNKIYFVDWERAILTQIPYVGENYDLANMYVYSFINPDFQSAFCDESESFRVMVAYHALYKASYVLAFNKSDEKGLFEWCIKKLNEINL